VSDGPSMDGVIVTRLFQSLAYGQQGRAGAFRVDASTPEAMQELTVLVLDSVAFERFLVPALELAGVEIVRLGR